MSLRLGFSSEFSLFSTHKRLVWLGFVCIVLIVLIGLVVSGFFAWQLRAAHKSWVASTSKGNPLLERPVLEVYGDRIVEDLIAQNVRVAIVSRSGQARSDLPAGIQYTHSAFWLYEPTDGNGAYRVYNLYHGEADRLTSSLVADDPADFLRLTREHDVGIIIPDRRTQLSLRQYIQSPDYQRVHQEAYSLISNPLDVRFQNCNEFMLDTMAAHFWETFDPAYIKQRYQDTLTPTRIKTSFIRRMLGPVIDERLILADQDRVILTTTRQTLVDFLRTEKRLDKAYVLDLRGVRAGTES